MLVIFLDIDGVLNNQTYFINNSDRIAKFYDSYSDLQYNNSFDLHVERIMMDIDEEKLSILKKIVLDTDAKIVIISSWKTLCVFDEVVKRLCDKGIPIIGRTYDESYNRGRGIYNYLKHHDVMDYVILDDEIFEDYDPILLNKLIKTDFYGSGLTLEHADLIRKKLKK